MLPIFRDIDTFLVYISSGREMSRPLKKKVPIALELVSNFGLRKKNLYFSLEPFVRMVNAQMQSVRTTQTVSNFNLVSTTNVKRHRYE